MSIATYDELKTAIVNWSHRTDLTSRLGEFISLAESRISRMLKTSGNQSSADLTAEIDSDIIALPADYSRPVALWITTYSPEQLVYATKAQMPYDDESGEPEYWTIDGRYIQFECPCDAEYTFRFDYYASLALSDASPTNWLLTQHPDVYLYASLMEQAAYVRDLEQLQVWKAAFDTAMAEVNDNEARAGALSTLFVDPALSALGGSTNIFEG